MAFGLRGKVEENMTAENRRFINLDEVVALEYTCSKCGVRVSMPRKKSKWKKIPYACPGGCTTAQGGANAWFDEEGDEPKNVLMLVNSIERLISAKQNGLGCTLRLVLQEDVPSTS